MEFNFASIKQSRYYVVIFILTFVIYGNSINNEYSLDDNIVVNGNKLVEQGLSAIPEIFTSRYSTDKNQSYDYRPVVIASFAIEKQFFDKLPASQTKKQKKRKDKLTQANISHFINVLLYAITCVLLFVVLQSIIPSYSVLFSFLITLFFLVHPLHTEVVCSLKNRDELIVFIAVLLSLKHFIFYAKKGAVKYLVFALLFMCLAMFTKANGLAIIALSPVVLYFVKAKNKTILISVASMIVMLMAIRVFQNFLIDSEDQVRMFKYFENPLMHEPWSIKRWSAVLYCNWFYFKSLIFPKDLLFYYGYNQIPIATWGFWQVWVSLCITFGLGIYGFYLFLKREILGLGIVICFGLMMGINNFWILLPGIVADRFTYMLSLGFCIVLVWALVKLFKVDVSSNNYKFKLPQSFVIVVLAILFLYSGRTIIRNPNWHDEMTLYTHDIEYLTESAKAHALLANVLYPMIGKEVRVNPMNPQNQKEVERLVFHYQEAIRIDSTYLTSINNLGSAYLNFKKDYDKTIYYCSKAVAMDDNYLEAHFNLGYAYMSKGEEGKAMPHFIRVMEINPDYMQVYQEYNKMVFKSGKLAEGIDLLKKATKNIGKPKNIYLNIGNLYSLDNYNVAKSIVYFVKAFEQDKTDKQLCNHISTLYNSVGDAEKANYYKQFFLQ